MTAHEQVSGLTKLRGLVAQEATGELIAAQDTMEVHVFLQSGNVAWATSSNLQRVFTQRLMTTCKLEKETLNEVFRECQKSKKPLGETLVSWNIATNEQVRDALLHQIKGALYMLLEFPVMNCLFLQRESVYSKYDSTFTFALEQLLDKTPKPPLSLPSKGNGMMSLPVHTLDALERVRRTKEIIPDASWVRLVQGDDVMATTPPGDSRSMPTARAAAMTLGEGADFVSLRSSAGTAYGFALKQEDTSLWCGFEPGANTATALWALDAEIGNWFRTPDTHGGPARDSVITRSHGSSPALKRIGEVMSQAEGLLAVLIVDSSGNSFVHQSDTDLIRLGSLAAKQTATLLMTDALSPNSSEAQSAPTGGSAVMSYDSRWVFFTIPASAPDAVLWIAVDQATPRGIGWALLSAVARRL